MNGENKHTGENMPKTITSLNFNVNGKSRTDTELIGLANEFARLPEYEGISPTSLIRNFFIRKFREAINTAKSKQLMGS